MTPIACTHPDHVDGSSCEDRAVGCSPDCRCCIPVRVLSPKEHRTVAAALVAFFEAVRS